MFSHTRMNLRAQAQNTANVLDVVEFLIIIQFHQGRQKISWHSFWRWFKNAFHLYTQKWDKRHDSKLECFPKRAAFVLTSFSTAVTCIVICIADSELHFLKTKIQAVATADFVKTY